MLPKLAGGKLYSDYAGRFVFMIFILLSIPLGVHHQFAEPGISSGYKDFQSFLTHLIAIPSLITAFNLASSLEYAGKKNGATGILGWMKKLPYANTDKYMFAYLISGLLIFILGGIGGIINASHGMSNVVHNTALIPGHFHLTVGGPVFLAIIGMNMFLLEGLTGKRVVSKRLHLTVPYLWMLGLLIMSTGMKLGGSMGEPRRTNLGLSYLNRSHELFTPEWVLTTVILIVIAYYGPLKEAVTNSETNSLPYQPNNPSPEKIIIK
ncbi:hypothetical protein CHS0354_000718 [Potamilus streckersoni]|uniref:Cytochrome c oxidase subunit 1 n=1 Tax=Potamilus streckersoni TaxID=2493646 RepID=A0AAE0T751_9BIVA|nr:hypothetical protein CHS0354_000718 [Potamilus streckersoni]